MVSDSHFDWTGRLPPGAARAVRELLDRATASDGVAPVSEPTVLSLTTSTVSESTGVEASVPELPTTARHRLDIRDGVVTGYANLVAAQGEHPAMAEVVVDPRWRGQGIGGGLVAAALSEGGSGARIWAHGNLPSAQAVAARLGLRIARELWQLRRSLATSELPALTVPGDILLRTYRGPVDDAELLRVNNAAFHRHPEQGGWTERDIALRRNESWFDPRGLFIAADPDHPARILGFHWTKVHYAPAAAPLADGSVPEPAGSIGEVYIVGIDPAAQGRGLGRLLTSAGLQYLRDRGLDSVLLYTEASNTAAVHTYTRLGFSPFHVDVAYTEGVIEQLRGK